MAVNYYWRVALLWMYAVVVASSQKTLHFSYITAKTGSSVSSGAIPVVDLALEQINNRTDILPNYNLSYNTTILDSKVNEILIEPSIPEVICMLEVICMPLLTRVALFLY